MFSAPLVLPVPWNLRPATFVERPNRFLTRIRIDGRIHDAHLPDPGRLKELLYPGVDLLVQHNPGPRRKTAWTVHLVRHHAGHWVCINTLLPNLFVEFLLRAHRLPFLSDWTLADREVTIDHSRFDFRLTRGAQSLYLEVKSVTWAEGGIARFPDAVSARAARHIRHLADLLKDGHRAMVLFVIQRDDAHIFQPMWDTDPAVGYALNQAQAVGVPIHAVKVSVTPESFTYRSEVPVDLNPPSH